MLLQQPLNTQKIDAKYFQGYRLAKKEDKNSKKDKSTDISLTDILSWKQPSSTYQNHQRSFWHYCR